MENGLEKMLEEDNRRTLSDFPDTDPAVLRFISDMMSCYASTEKEYDVIRATFRAGYCWHFAHMLKDTFNRGEVCWAAPFGHFVWVDDNGVPYDAEGRNYGEQLYNIPESYMGDRLKSFTHIPGDSGPDTPTETIIDMIRAYEDDGGLPHQEICL